MLYPISTRSTPAFLASVLLLDFVCAGQASAQSQPKAAIGGRTAYLQKPEDARGIYDRILNDINSRYILGYYPSDKSRDGKRRQVQVEVRGHPEYTVSGRKSYSAPPVDQ